MKISLGHLDARALHVDLPGPGDDTVSIRTATGLRGTLEQDAERLVLSGVAAERVELDALRLLLGELVLAMDAGATLAGVEGALEQTKNQLVLQVTSTSLEAPVVNVVTGDVLVRGRFALTSPRLAIHGAEGSLSSQRVELADFMLRIGDVELAAETVIGLSVEIAWGEAGFRLVAGSLDAPSLRFTAPDVRLAASGVALAAVSLHGPKISIGRVALERGEVAVAFPPAPALAAGAAPAPEPAPAPAAGDPVVDWNVLDALSGQLDIDVVVDLTVPIIGRRQATHRLRVAVADGAIDFRALEKNLARLEDALLDFAVRDGALVLERVNPLFPARGHGKPVVIWDVDAAGLELAGRDRVRLAVLPRARLASDGDDRDREPTKSSIALRQLELRDIKANLALAPGPLSAFGQLRLRHVGRMVLAGSVFHDPAGSPREGSMLGELFDLAGSVDGLTLGTTRLDVTTLTAGALSPIELTFAGVSPTEVKLGLAALVLEGIDIASRVS